MFALREPVSAGTHLAAMIGAVYGALLLWRLCRGDRLKRWSTACFSVSMIVLFAASGSYHAASLAPAELHLLRLLDLSAIYGLIAGTYTPVFAILLRGRRRRNLLITIWGLAVLGIVGTWMLSRTLYGVSVGVYLVMGWSGAVALPELTRAVGLRAMAWGVLGGLFYTVGALCDVACWPVLSPGLFGSHELFHVLGIIGTFLHYLFVIRYVVPFRRPVAASLETPARTEEAPLEPRQVRAARDEQGSKFETVGNQGPEPLV